MIRSRSQRRAFSTLFLATLTSSFLSGCEPPGDAESTAAQALSANQHVKIVYHLDPAKCVDVASGSKSSGAQLHIWDCGSTVESQSWTLKSVPGSSSAVYQLVNDNSGLCMDTPGASKKIHTVLDQETCATGRADQEWKLVPRGSSYALESNNSDLCLDLLYHDTTDGTIVQQYTCTSTDTAQTWDLVPTTTEVPDAGRPVDMAEPRDAATPSSTYGTTWYIREDGGTNTQCTGKKNAPYPGSGTAQACAFNHPYQMLKSDGSWAAFASGDTIQFADSSTASHTYYMGEQNGGLGTDWSTQLYGICSKPNGASYSCMLPAPPSGTAAHHTKIIGQNAGACHDSEHTHLVNPTVLSGLASVFGVLDFRDTDYVDVSCIAITQPDTCTRTVNKGQCSTSANFVGYGGIILNYLTAQGPSNLTLEDIAVVGLGGSGILGSHLNKASTDVFTATDVYVIGNGGAGWNGDGGGCGTDCESVGTMNLKYVTVDWNGCVAVKPYNFAKASTGNAFNYCYGQNDGGYGDGFVQIAAGDLTLNVDHSMFRWNTQDGFDGLHLSDDVSTHPSTHVTNSRSEGNAGQTFKIGAGASSTAINNVSVSNCRVLSDASAFPLNPSGWTLDTADDCRAAGDEWAFQMDNDTVITLENNTSVGYGTTMYDVGCAALAPDCMTNGAKFIFKNNISKGFPDPGNANRLASGFYFGSGNPFANAGSVADHNLWATMDSGCPDPTITPTETHAVCADPMLVGESNINAINPNITTSSPAKGAGIAVSGITTDYNGVTRPNPPSIGAFEP